MTPETIVILFPFIVLAPALWSIYTNFVGNAHASQTHDTLFGIAMSGLLLLMAWIPGILTIYSGVCIKRRTKRLLSLLTGGLNCVLLPFGTALGISTLALLSRQSTKKIYGG